MDIKAKIGYDSSIQALSGVKSGDTVLHSDGELYRVAMTMDGIHKEKDGKYYIYLYLEPLPKTVPYDPDTAVKLVSETELREFRKRVEEFRKSTEGKPW